MEHGAFAPKEQMLHFPKYFQLHDISRASNDVIMEPFTTSKVSKGVIME